MSATKTSIYTHHSLGQMCDDNSGDLQLRVSCHGADAIEIDLTTQRFKEKRQNRLKKLLIVCCFYGIYCAMIMATFSSSSNAVSASPAKASIFFRTYVIDLAFLLCMLYILHSIFNLVKGEKLLFCLDFGLQLQTEFFGSRRRHFFIPAANIHDVVINEVIEDMDIHYILIVRTKGSLFKRKPIIAIFNSLRPSIDCLEVIYKHLHKIMRETANALG